MAPVNLDIYFKSKDFENLKLGALAALEENDFRRIFPTYESFKQLCPQGHALILDLVEAESFDESLWLVKVNKTTNMCAIPFDLGNFLQQESNRVGDGVIKEVFYCYEYFLPYVLQYCPAAPANAKVWFKKTEHDKAEVVAQGRLSEMKTFIAVHHAGIVKQDGKIWGDDPARAWTLDGKEALRPGLDWKARRRYPEAEAAR